jgi:hypothetical protein
VLYEFVFGLLLVPEGDYTVDFAADHEFLGEFLQFVLWGEDGIVVGL